MNKLSDMLTLYWIFSAILKFYDQINIEIEILDHENLLLGVFHHFLCQLQTETCKFNGFGRHIEF